MKYEHNCWRPVTAIREAGQDGNPDTAADPDWAPLLDTPPFPTCTSGHSTFSGAAAKMLALFFGRIRHLSSLQGARMIEECARGGKLATTIQQIWLPIFTPPPPPSYVPKDVFMAKMKAAIEKRFGDTIAAVEKLRARGGKVVFVRLPVSGGLKALEDRTTPRNQTWDPLLQGTGAPGIYFEDFPELAGFNCPEWSHLSAGDSVEFSKRLVPHLRAALGM
jgi:hypothetical protein